jgi:flagellar hook-basal body complex protein FliE
MKHDYGRGRRGAIGQTEHAFGLCSARPLARTLLFWQPDFAGTAIVLARRRHGCAWRRQSDGGHMNIGGIDSSRIESMMAQLKAAASKPAQGVAAPGALAAPNAAAPAAKVDFADALKASLDGVAAAENKAATQGQAFAMGDDKVSLSDVMISMQKANIGFQATVQVRNKLVSAYHEIMNMQI